MTKMVDERIERVAKAIQMEAEFKAGDKYWLQTIGGKGKPLYRELAQAALAALPPEQEVSEENAAEVMANAYEWGNTPTSLPHKMVHVVRALRAAGMRIVKGGSDD